MFSAAVVLFEAASAMRDTWDGRPGLMLGRELQHRDEYSILSTRLATSTPCPSGSSPNGEHRQRFGA